MTIELHPHRPDTVAQPEEIVRFVFSSVAAAGLLKNARALLDAAPKELAESFEQAVRSAGLAS